MRRRFISDFHFPLLAAVFFFCVIGIFNLYSATHQSGGALYLNQIYRFIAGFFLMALFLFVDYRIFERLAYPLFIFTLILLVAVLFLGPKIFGARRWFDFGILRFQPSELMKIAMVMTLAKYFSDDHTIGGYTLRKLFMPISLVVVSAGLVAIEPDLGTALMICFIAFSIFLFVKIRLRSLVIMGMVAALSVPFAYQFILKDYQRDRVKTFLNPSRDPRGKGYHSIQSMIAVGSGRLYGKGYLKGSQTQLAFLPEQHTDFVFSVFAEEHGFVGVTIILFAYIIFLWMGLDIAASARDKFGAIMALGLTSMFFWHAFVNIGMVIGVMPVVGLTLPFFSYGGSSVLMSMAAVGLLMSIYLRRVIF